MFFPFDNRRREHRVMPESIVDKSHARMTHRERFRRLMHFQTVDRGVHWEFGYLNETQDRWHGEGLPAEYQGNAQIEAYFGVDPVYRVPMKINLVPPFEGEDKVLEEKDGRRVIQKPNGTILEEQIEGQKTIPHYIKFPIANRDDWQRFKERLDPDTPQRNEVDYRALGEELRACDKPVGVGIGSFFGWVRDWVGFENLCLMCYDDRELVEEMTSTLADLFYAQLSKLLPYIQPDFASGWEDICFRNGPMISPAMFEEIVIPGVKKVCTLLRQHGCTVIFTDCDGDIRPLVPLWLDAGLNCMFPLEVHPGSDPVALRKEYGHDILLIGGMEKYRFSKSRREILDEIKRIEPVFRDGGFIPHGDHRIPQDVSYENYRYYVREKLTMMGWDKEEIGSFEPLRGVE